METHPVLLTVDSEARLGDGHTWLRTHDADGQPRYVSGEDVESVGRHTDEDPALTPAWMLAKAEGVPWPPDDDDHRWHYGRHYGRGSTRCGDLTDPHQGLSITDPIGSDATYWVVFEHIEDAPIDKLIARVRDANELAEVIYHYVRPHLLCDAQVEVDLTAMHGRIMFGLRPLGTFAIELAVLPPAIPGGAR